MNAEYILHLGQRTIETAMLLVAPVLAATLGVSLVVAMLQAVTSVRDMTVGVIFKLLCVALTVLMCGGWMMHVARGFTREVLDQIQTVGG